MVSKDEWDGYTQRIAAVGGVSGAGLQHLQGTGLGVVAAQSRVGSGGAGNGSGTARVRDHAATHITSG